MKSIWHSITKYNIFSLKLVGLWPEHSIKYKTNLYLVYAVISINLFINCHVVSQIAQIFVVYKNIEQVTGIIFIILPQIMACVKVYTFTQNIQLIKKLIRLVNSKLFQPNNLRQVVNIQQDLYIWKTMYFSFHAIVAITSLFLLGYPLMSHFSQEYKLPFAAWYPFSVKTKISYAAAYLYQTISNIFLAFTHLNIDTLLPAIFIILGNQCTMLCDNLRNSQRSTKKIMLCIKHHQEILRFCILLSLKLEN